MHPINSLNFHIFPVKLHLLLCRFRKKSNTKWHRITSKCQRVPNESWRFSVVMKQITCECQALDDEPEHIN